MKSDSIQFSTNKSIQECANIIRQAAGKLKANMVKINDDPMGGLGGPEPAISVGLEGKNILGFGARGWGVQVFVTDMGNSRAVELIALGDGIMAQMSGGEFFDLGLGKKQRNKIAEMLS